MTRRLPFHRIVPLLVVFFVFGGPFRASLPAQSGSASAGSGSPLTEEQKKQHAELTKSPALYSKALASGNLDEALAIAEKALTLSQSVFGPDHEVTLSWWNGLASVHIRRDDLEAARKTQAQHLQILEKKHGKDHWQVTDVRVLIAHTDSLMGLTKQQKQEVKKINQWTRQAKELKSQEKEQEARVCLQRALESARAILGERDYKYGALLTSLASSYHEGGDNARAEPLFLQAKEIAQKVFGENHPNCAVALINLARLYNSKSEYSKSERYYKEALNAYKESLGPWDHWYVVSLNDLAGVHRSQGDLAQAERLYEQALKITRETVGEKHPDYVAVLGNLASLYRSRAEYAKSEELYKRVLELSATIYGVKHPRYSENLQGLAELYQSWGRFAKAEPLYQQALEITRATSDKSSPDYSRSLNNMGTLYLAQREFAQAELLFKEALELRRAASGEKSLSYANTLNNLAGLYFTQGDAGKAEPPARAALNVFRTHLDDSAAHQSEHRQFTHARSKSHQLYRYLSIAQEAEISPQLVYEQVLAWKGAIFLRQRQLRTVRQSIEQQPEAPIAATFRELESVSRQLAGLSLTTSEPTEIEPDRQRLQKLQERKDKLELELLDRYAPYREGSREVGVTPGELSELLPQDTALIDMLEYAFEKPDPKDKQGRGSVERRILVFVVRKGQSLVMLDLKNANEIVKAVERWRTPINSRTKPTEGADDPATVLRARVWEPLLPHLGDAKTVLISPDGVLNTLPFGALPGKNPNKYLLEETAIAVLPVPQLLYSLQKKPERRDSLLVVGNVDFDAAPGVPKGIATGGERGKDKLTWPALPGTRAELERVRSAFKARFPEGKLTDLEGKNATEEAVRQNLTSAGIVHLGTHGFFAPPTLKSVLRFDPEKDKNSTFGELSRQQVIGYNPGLLSGIVCTGANRESKLDQDDGILTATELSGLNLNKVDLMVLSACETGLGQTAGGEGLLGLQRSMQLAGVRTSICSLWSVHDAATSVLMEEFYKRLWDKEKPPGKLEALRQAQLFVLKNPEKVIERTRELKADLAKRGLPEDSYRGPKGDEAVELPGGGVVKPGERRSPTAWWAAFVLAGEQ